MCIYSNAPLQQSHKDRTNLLICTLDYLISPRKEETRKTLWIAKIGGSKGSNSNSNSQVGNGSQNAGGGGKSSNVGGASGGGGGGGGNAAGNMKAPGREYAISKKSFESNPAAYFKDLRK
ncbi:hypothetical protein CerSpe_113220 [Prunus speciosa]